MTKKQIEDIRQHRDAILRICSSVRSCRKCPLIIGGPIAQCAGRYLAATYNPKRKAGNPGAKP